MRLTLARLVTVCFWLIGARKVARSYQTACSGLSIAMIKLLVNISDTAFYPRHEYLVICKDPIWTIRGRVEAIFTGMPYKRSHDAFQLRAIFSTSHCNSEAGQRRIKEVCESDISRWGRFQDADESAYYEYLCRRSGIEVRYCTEPFENDGSPMATIMKSVKRAMAGEYSRELSNKVFQG